VLASYFSNLLLAYLLLDGSSQSRISSKETYHQNLTLDVQLNFSSLSGHLFDVTAQILCRLVHHREQEQAYNRTGFANAQKRLFGEGNYEFYIGTFQGISGFHQINDMNTQDPKDFLQDKPSLESNYKPHIYLLRG
jgi:hypothetical protein